MQNIWNLLSLDIVKIWVDSFEQPALVNPVLSKCKRLFFYMIDSKFAEEQVLGKGREIFCLEDTDGQVLAKGCEIL